MPETYFLPETRSQLTKIPTTPSETFFDILEKLIIKQYGNNCLLSNGILLQKYLKEIWEKNAPINDNGVLHDFINQGGSPGELTRLKTFYSVLIAARTQTISFQEEINFKNEATVIQFLKDTQQRYHFNLYISDALKSFLCVACQERNQFLMGIAADMMTNLINISNGLIAPYFTQQYNQLSDISVHTFRAFYKLSKELLEQIPISDSLTLDYELRYVLFVHLFRAKIDEAKYYFVVGQDELALNCLQNPKVPDVFEKSNSKIKDQLLKMHQEEIQTLNKVQLNPKRLGYTELLTCFNHSQKIKTEGTSFTLPPKEILTQLERCNDFTVDRINLFKEAIIASGLFYENHNLHTSESIKLYTDILERTYNVLLKDDKYLMSYNIRVYLILHLNKIKTLQPTLSIPEKPVKPVEPLLKDRTEAAHQLLKKRQDELNALKEKNAALKKNKAKQQHNIETKKSALKAIETLLENKKTAITEADTKIKNQEKQIAELQTQYEEQLKLSNKSENTKKEQRLAELKLEKRQLEENSLAQDQIDTLTKQKETSHKKYKHLAQKLNAIEAELNALTASISALDTTKVSLTEQNRSEKLKKQTELDVTKEKVEQLKSSSTHLKTAYEKTNEKLLATCEQANAVDFANANDNNKFFQHLYGFQEILGMLTDNLDHQLSCPPPPMIYSPPPLAYQTSMPRQPAPEPAAPTSTAKRVIK